MAGRAHGKAILIGEHAVVHGAPAIAMPVSLSVRVTLGTVPAPDLPPAFVSWFTSIAAESGRAGQVPARIDAALPVGVGLGSSAALVVASLRALGVSDPRRLLALGDAGEAIFHGNPSGLDVRTVLADRPQWFRRGANGLELSGVAVRQPMAFELWVTPPGPSTGEMVARVSEAVAAHGREAAVAAATPHVEAARAALATGDAPALGRAMSAFHEWLRRYRASTPRLDALAEAAMTAGALGAKLTGAGGGGAVLVLWPSADAARAPVGDDVRRYSIRLSATRTNAD